MQKKNKTKMLCLEKTEETKLYPKQIEATQRKYWKYI